MSHAVRALLLVAGLAVIALLIVRTGPALLLELLARIGWQFVTIVLVYAAHVVLRAVSLWGVICERRVRFSDVLRVRLAAEAVEVLTYTGPFLAEPAKGWLLTRRGLSPVDAFAAVATEYLLYTAVAAALALLAFVMLATGGPLPSLVRPAAFAVVVAMAAFLAAVCFAAISGIGLIVPALGRLSPLVGRARAARAIETLIPVEQQIVRFLHARPAALTWVTAAELIGHALFIVEIRVVLMALQVPFSSMDPIVFEGSTKIGGFAFFYVPGQLGASEALYAALARGLGWPASVGLTLALVRRLRSICVAVVGLLAFTARSGGNSSPHPAKDSR